MKTARLDSLTGLRFFAALLVFGYHGMHVDDSGGTQIFAAGMSGVSFFYLVSGFVLAWSAREGDRPALFYRRRFARIYPSYLAVWAATLALSTLSGDTLGWVDLAPLTLLQSWVPIDAVYFATSAVFWSLSCEAFFYLVFPWVFPLLRDLSTARLVWVLLGCVVGVATIASATAMWFDDATVFWFATIFPPARLLEFIAGITLALLVKRGHLSRIPLWVAGAAVAASILAAPLAPESFTRSAVTLVPFLVLIWSAATADITGRASLLQSAPVVRLGVWSYGFYLLHTQVMAGVFMVVQLVDLTPVWLGHVIALIVAIGAAAALYRVVERPFERRLRPQPVTAGATH